MREGDEAATPAFLIGDRTLDRAPAGAFAVRRRVGRGIGLTVSAEAGDVSLWQIGATGPLSDGWRRYGYGQVAAGFDARSRNVSGGIRLTRMTEGATVLGSCFGPALGGGGAVGWFADASAGMAIGAWRIDATWRRGWTVLGGNGVREGSTLARGGVFTTGDRFTLRYAEPMRVTGAGCASTSMRGLPNACRWPRAGMSAIGKPPICCRPALARSTSTPIGGGSRDISPPPPTTWEPRSATRLASSAARQTR